jgi:hypothetical protein
LGDAGLPTLFAKAAQLALADEGEKSSMNCLESLKAQVDRRELLRLGALAGIGRVFMPRLAWAAAQPNLSPQVTALIERWVGPGKFPGMVAALA